MSTPYGDFILLADSPKSFLVNINIGDAIHGIENLWPENLIGWWPFDEGTGVTAYDKTPNNNDGTLINMEEADWVDGKVGKALDFDGVDEHVGGINFGSTSTTELTQIYWIKKDALSGVHRISNIDPFTCGFTSANFFVHTTTTSGIDVNLPIGSIDMTADEWHMLAITRETDIANKVKVYLDGDLKLTGDLVNSANGTMTLSAFIIGNTSNSFDGLIDEVRIYNRVLTEDEIKDLYELKGKDYQGWTQHNIHTNLWYTLYEKVPNKIYEDGNQYTERFTLAEANTNANSFYYDFEERVLYLHTSGSDNPGKQTGGVYDYFILAFVWKNYSNTSPIVFPRRQEALIDGGFEEWLSPTNLTHWVENIAGGSTINREADITKVYNGGYCVRLDIDASNNMAQLWQTTVHLVPRGKTKIRFWYKNSTTGKTARFVIRDLTASVYLDLNGDWQTGSTEVTLPNATIWTYYELEFYSHKDYTNYQIILKRGNAASSSIWFDKAELIRYREDNYYEPLLQSANLPAIHQAVSDYHVAAMKMQFGRLRFNNPNGIWYPEIQNYYWHNKEVVVRYGEEDSDWEDYDEIFQGRTKKPEVEDKYADLTISDKRVLVYKEVPATKFWTSNYPNLEEEAEGLPIPIIYGEFENVVPVCINTALYKYKVANHALNAILAIYKDGKLLAGGGVDYTTDLANGEFTLIYHPGEAVISCDVQGKPCDLQTGGYSTNIADFTYDLLKTYGGIDEIYLDKESFLDLKTWRTAPHHLYLDIGKSIIEILRVLQASALFHIIPTDEKLGAFRYIAGTDSSTPTFKDEDYGFFKLIYDTSGVYKQVKLRYNRNPGNDKYEIILRTKDQTEWAHDEVDTLTITTTLKGKTDAENLADYYIDLLKDPLRKVKANLPTQLFDMRPAEKVLLSKTRECEKGQSVTVLDNIAYRVLDLKKDMKTKRVNIIAWEDLQSSGELFCEVCYTCQTCDTLEEGVCQVCVTCEKCDTGQCTTCESCFYCQKCDSGQCTACQICVACEKCNTGECPSCEICVACEKCDTGECTACQTCDVCQKCDTCQNAQCTACENCDTCEKCNTGECTACQICVACEKCDAGECAACQICVGCEKCDTGECAACQLCVACEKCNTCQNAQCNLCESCDVCQLCNTCQQSECTVCEDCNICQKCDSGECTSCQICNICQKCNTGECADCQTCVACEKCNTGECSGCQICVACEKCDTCQNAQCTTCENCDICQLCNTCQNAQCTACEVCDLCQKCDTCQNAQCTTCMDCVACQKCDSGQCTTCQICVACMLCNTGECTTCMSCNICQKCDAGECTACQKCVACEKCNTGECTTCQICVGCELCNTCQNSQCTICQICVGCESCNVCMKCNNCMSCINCEECVNCQQQPM